MNLWKNYVPNMLKAYQQKTVYKEKVVMLFSILEAFEATSYEKLPCSCNKHFCQHSEAKAVGTYVYQ